MVQKRETKAINKLCVREILSLSFVCGAYFFEFRGRNLVCFVIAYNFNGKYALVAGKTRMRTAFFTRAVFSMIFQYQPIRCTDLTEVKKYFFSSFNRLCQVPDHLLRGSILKYDIQYMDCFWFPSKQAAFRNRREIHKTKMLS